VTNILHEIEQLENDAESLGAKLVYQKTTIQDLEGSLKDANRRPSDDKIVLDPKLDPDPYGHHNMSLVYRLQCMGWRE
jgi:hypothetical protein